MKRYRKLIQDAVGGNQPGYNTLAREMGSPSSSIHEWATFPHKVPTYKSLERIAEYFSVPLPTLLMDADSQLIAITEALYKADQSQIDKIKKILDIKPCQ